MKNELHFLIPPPMCFPPGILTSAAKLHGQAGADSSVGEGETHTAIRKRASIPGLFAALPFVINFIIFLAQLATLSPVSADDQNPAIRLRMVSICLPWGTHRDVPFLMSAWIRAHALSHS